MAVLRCVIRRGNSTYVMLMLKLAMPMGVPFYMSASQFSYWEHTHLILDAIPGTGGQFSLERPTGLRFLIRSRLYSDEEWEYLKKNPVKNCG